MEAVKKYWFWGIFISVLAIFAMSHNANAIDFSLNFDDYSLARNVDIPGMDLFYDTDNTTCNNVQSCSPVNTNSFVRVKKLTTHQNFGQKAGDILVLRVFIGSQNQLSGSYVSGTEIIQNSITTNNNNLIYIGSNIVDVSERQNFISSLGYGPNANEFYTQITTIYHDLKVYEYYFKVHTDFTGQIGFESENYNSNAYNLWSYASYSSPGSVYFKIINFKAYRPSESKENKEVEEKTQNAVDDSQAAGGSSSTDAQTGTTGLLNAITGAVSVISSAQPTNCKINGNMGNLDIGQLDLCANPAPAFVQTIGSLILILMCVPLAISLFNRFIAIFRSFQS